MLTKDRASPPGPGRFRASLRSQAARRMAVASLAMLLAASLLGVAAYEVVLSNAARQEARTVETFFSGKLRELDEDWARQAFRQKARIEILGLADAGPDRWAKLYPYFVAQGEEQHFCNVFLVKAGGVPVFWYGQDGERLAKAIGAGHSRDWHYDEATNRLFRCFHLSVWMGADGAGSLVLLRHVDNALLYLNTTSRTGLTLSWMGREVAASLRSASAGSGWSRSASVESSLPWPGGREPSPVLHLSHVVEPPVSGMQVAGAVAGMLALQALFIWAVLGRWLVRVGRRVSQLSQASRVFTAQWPGEGRLPLKLDAEILSKNDEISEVAHSLKSLTEAVAEHDSQRTAHQEEMRGMRNLLTGIVDSMPSALITLDHEGRITRCNRKAELLSGVPDGKASGRPLEEVFPWLGPLLDPLLASMRQGALRSFHKHPLRDGGNVLYEDVTVYPLAGAGVEGAVVRLDDVTERSRMEQMMIQSEKILSVGGLAAGMAHEINNPLGGILQSAQVIERRVGTELEENRAAAQRLGCSLETIRAYLEARGVLDMLDGVRDSAQRASRIVSGMLEFSRRADAPFAPASLPEILDKAVELSSQDYDLTKRFDFRRIAIERRYEPGIPPVRCSPTQIEQVAMNLLRNAAQAMTSNPADKPPRIILGVRQEEGEAVFVLEDNGPGLDQSQLSRIFEPFYTTKPPGVGTGLGLSVSYFIVTQNHGGSMSAESLPGSFTRFTVRLPLEPGAAPPGGLA